MATLEQFAIAPLAGALPRTLSAGQRQRVALARALVVEPRVMLMDEPLAALDAQLRPRVRAELKALLRQANVPTLIVSHDPMDAIELQGRVVVMEQGRIVQQGTYESLLSAPASPFVAEFVEANAYRGRVVEVDAGTGSRIRLEAGADIHAITDDLFRHVLVVIYPWDVVLLRTPDMGSIRNVFAGRVASITRLRNRVRVMVEAAFPITAEITGASLEHLELREGSPVYAAVKTTAIRVVATDAPGVEREMTDLEAVPL